ncbi:MAG: GNAT family N-acetyltransferase [Myxococcales bacterium]|nr:GNAT family N-acetyltransferase [Myxococcales bacterium]
MGDRPSVIRLQRPSTARAPSFLESIAEMRALGETIWEGWEPGPSESLADFVRRLQRAEHSPAPGRVPESIYWAVRDGVVVGRIALRHRLNASLEEFGGHIGYEVRPSARREGVGKEMLRLLLARPKARELGRVLLTCAPDNIASNRTILANGGVLTRSAFVERCRRRTNYYWIDLSSTTPTTSRGSDRA